MPPRKDFEKHLSKEPLQPLYALLSSEPLLLSDAVARLRKRTITVAPDFNRDDFEAGETAATRVVEAAGTLPMMAQRRWVSFSNIQKLKASDIGPLLKYLQSPSPSTVLCLFGTKVDQRTKFAQALNKAKASFLFEPPKQLQLATWIKARAEARGFALEADAAQLLADIIGVDLGSLDSSLDKLWSYVGGEGSIAYDDVEAVVAPTRVHSIFELTDAIGSRNLATATVHLRNAMEGGESGLRVLAMIARQLRQLLKIKSIGPSRPSEIARKVGVPPFLVDSLMRQANRYEAKELCAALGAAGDADVRMKSTRVNHGVVLDRFLVDMMSGEGNP